MGKRSELHRILVGALGTGHVYYQPPESLKIEYPAIIYSRNNIDNRFADDTVYKQDNGYSVIVVDSDPDSKVVSRVSALPRCRFDRHYTSDNLNHDVFTIYY